MSDRQRIRAALGTPELDWLVERLRRRIEHGRPLTGTITLHSPGREQRMALEALLGRRPRRGGAVTVPLEQLERVLADAGLASTLRDAVHELHGPVENRRARRIEEDDAWRELFDRARERIGPRELLVVWLDDLRANGLLKRLTDDNPERARALLESALDALDRLPAKGQPLAEFAAELTGNSHGLDPGAPLATLLVRAGARWNDDDVPTDAEGRRGAWAGLGILCDELSAPVLTYRLPAGRCTFTGRMLAEHALRPEPYRVSVRQLLRDPPRFGPELHGAPIHICENPSILESAANRLGPRCAPLICVEGQPCTAANLLLRRLRDAGACLVYHGDFDWGGLRIGNVILRRYGATPWRFGTEDYLKQRLGTALTGTPVDASWDPELKNAMLREGRAVHEEQLADVLLEDLGANA